MILHTLKAISGSLAKQAILATADTYDKQMFQYAYDNKLMYNMKWNNIRWDTVKPFNEWDRSLLDRIINEKIRGTAARNLVEEHCLQYGDLVKLICNKDLDVGVSVKSLNKAFGSKFLEDFPVALADEIDINKVTLPCIGQLKYNGVRVVTIITKENIEFKTRNGHAFEYPKLAEYLSVLQDKYFDAPIMLDGELTFGDSKGSDHTGVAGLVNSAIKGNPVQAELTYNLFDTMVLHEFVNKSCVTPYIERYNNLTSICENVCYDLANKDKPFIVKLAETYEFNTHKYIEDKFAELLEQGYEGVILKHWDHIYSFKRSKDWIKVKDVKSCDIEVIGIQLGEGKYEGGIGALICVGEVEGKFVKVNVGSGLNDEQRMHTEPSSYVGDIIEVKYNTLIQDKTTGEWSLFLPRFIQIRMDKS